MADEVIAVFKADIEQFKAQMKDLQRSIKGVENSTVLLVDRFGAPLKKSFDDAGNAAGGFAGKAKSASGSISVLSKGLAGVTGLLGITGRLFGVSTEKLEGLIFASQQFVRVARDLQNAQKLSNVATDEGAKSTAKMAAASAASIPIIGAIVVAIGAAAAILIRYQDQIFGVTEAQKEKMKADDGVIISDEKLRASHNESLKTIRDLGIEYRLVTGEITEYQAVLENLKNKNKDAVDQIQKDTKVKVDDIIGFWAEVKLAAAGAIGLGGLETQKIIDDLGKVISDKNIAIGDANKQLSEEEKVARAKRFAEIDKEYQELLQALNDFEKKKAEEKKKAAEEALKAEEASLNKQFEAFIKFWDKEDAEELKREKAKAAQHIEDLRAQLKANAELLKAQEDAIEEKKKLAQKESDELQALNLANDELTAQVLREDREKLLKEEKELNDKRIDDAQRVSDIIFAAQQEAFDKRKELLDHEITDQQTNIETQRRLAEAGLANTLAFEEKRAADLRRQQQQEAEKQKKLKLLEVFINNLAEFSKAPYPENKNALSKALLQVALAQAASAVFAEEGGIIGEIGHTSNLRRRHKGGGDVLLHAQTGEGILSRREMDNLGKRNFHLLKDAARFPIRDDVFGMPKIALAGGMAVNNTEMVKELQGIRKELKSIPREKMDINKYGEYIHTLIQDGITTVNKGKMRKPRFK